ncbi:MAG: putative DNA-binding domain-containing protein [Steroidobacteraceae bacterium]
MPSLRSLQRDFLDALLGAGQIEGRLGLYQSNVRANFSDSLRSTYPAVRRLVGEDYFRQTALMFQRSHPSRSGDLAHVGRSFPEYLAALHGDDQYRYLGDIARLEWLCQEALLAAEHAPLDLERLRAVAPSDYDALRFELHPTLRLYQSAYPALLIWEANAANESEPQLIDLRTGGDRLALMRRAGKLTFLSLSCGEFAFLEALERGAPFGEAIAGAGACERQFDAGAALRGFIGAEAIVDYSTAIA